MEDLAKVRLVRCPKCENLLPELADYSVYQCGGCGAVLRAKDKACNPRSNSFSEKAAEEEEGGNSANSEGSLDADAKSNSGCDKREMLKEDVNADSKKLGKSIGRENQKYNSTIGSARGSKISDRISGRQNWERGEIDSCQRNQRTEMEGVRRLSSSKYKNVAPSNLHPGSSYGYGDQRMRHEDRDDATKGQDLELDRAELLRKLDELKDELSRHCHIVDNSKEKFPSDKRQPLPDSYGRSDAWFPDVSSGLNGVPMQFWEVNKHAAGRPSYIGRRHDPFSYANNHGTSVHHFPGTSSQHSNYVSGYQDPFGPQISTRASQHLLYQFPQQPIHPYFSGQYLNNSDTSDPLTHRELLHHPSPACFYSSEVKQQGSVLPLPATFADRRFPRVANNPLSYRCEFPGKFSPLNNSRTTTIPLANSRETQPHKRWPIELKPEMTSFIQNHPKQVMLACARRRCRPVSGGAPFLTCCSCFQLLQIPYEPLNMVRNHHLKVRCGACSTVMTLSDINRRLVISLHSESNDLLAEVVHSTGEAMKTQGIDSHWHNWSDAGANLSSDDCDNFGFDFQLIDKEPSSEMVLDSWKPQEMQNLHSSSPSSSDDPDVLITSREVISVVPQPGQAVPSPPPGSPLHEYSDHPSNHYAINRFGKGNQSIRLQHNSLKAAALATEIEVPVNDYSDNGGTQDSLDVGREHDQPRHNKGGESFFANIIKRSLKDFTRFNQSDVHGKGTVSVNGHIIPDRVVKKAEKLAGPIQPGKYWYDVHAGFWGVMDGPCLGIIPSFIEELNYPMPENCAGGNTGIFVNGRELHQSDLDLLGDRGLPIEANRSFIIEISGRVFDEDTGEELDSLGKLAPTVEKVKHGFGMKPPRVASK